VARGVTAADLDSLRFAWVEDCPNLQSNDDFNRLVETVRQAARNIRDQFGLPPVLIVIDTLSAAGSFKDANDAAEGQRIMNRLAALSRLTGAFVLAVDHFGKAVETGTRGTSAKEAAADVVLALLADREINGTISNTRMALRKLRGGKVGIETPFDLKVVDMDFGETTCAVEWKEARDPTQGSTPAKVRWPKSLRIFKSALETGLINHGKAMRPYGNEGPRVRAVSYDAVRSEFIVAYPAEKTDAKKAAFKRALGQAREGGLIGSREINGIDFLWLAEA
jgi:AAA domain